MDKIFTREVLADIQVVIEIEKAHRKLFTEIMEAKKTFKHKYGMDFDTIAAAISAALRTAPPANEVTTQP